MNVPIVEVWIEPWTLLVDRELASTLPETWWRGLSPTTKSSNCVSVRLNAVVWELAMFPEMFCSAKDCACSPGTAVVSASKIPITKSPIGWRRADHRRGQRCRHRARAMTHALGRKRCARQNIKLYQ